MHYRIYGVIHKRKIYAVLLCLLVLTAGSRGFAALSRRRQDTVKKHVQLAGLDLSGLTAMQAEQIIARHAKDVVIQPQNAVPDPITQGVIPDLNGLTIDVAQTVRRVMAAKSGTSVEPVWRQISAEVTLESFPAVPVYRGNPQKAQVSFLINVAWGNEYLWELVNVLRENEADATFFLLGRWVRGNSVHAANIAAAGFEIASHGFSDAISMGKAGYEAIMEDMQKASDVIEEICGVRPVYFSPHRGELSRHVLSAAEKMGVRPVLWTVDTVDWKLPGVDWMVRKISAKAENGSLILMHPTAQTAEFLRQVIPKLRQKGLEPVRLSALLCPRREYKVVMKP